jgi:hypothetical protein
MLTPHWCLLLIKNQLKWLRGHGDQINFFLYKRVIPKTILCNIGSKWMNNHNFTFCLVLPSKWDRRIPELASAAGNSDPSLKKTSYSTAHSYNLHTLASILMYRVHPFSLALKLCSINLIADAIKDGNSIE